MGIELTLTLGLGGPLNKTPSELHCTILQTKPLDHTHCEADVGSDYKSPFNSTEQARKVVKMGDNTNNDLPHRAIFNDVDMKHFMESSTKKEMLSFVEALGKACSTTPSSSNGVRFDPTAPYADLPPSMASLHGSLEEMRRWVDDFPPTTDDATVRFGNPSFRLWHSRLLERSNAIITVMLQARDSSWTVEEAAEKGKQAAAGTLKPDTDASIQQVSCYLHDAFGHAVRLDYGTGHESSFLVFLLVLSKVKCLGTATTASSSSSDGNDHASAMPSLKTLRAVALSIFDQYLKVTRRLQTEYRLEPAGSHGVWGLDVRYYRCCF